MITLANIRKAIYCLNKRIDLLEQNGISGGSSGEGASSSEVAEIRGKVEALESIISEGDNPTAAIDKFNEIVAFLESIQNTDTLSGLLADIATLIPTNVSELLNDAGYLTQHLDISGKSDKLSMNGENAAVEDNIMSISSNGNPKDSGISANNIALKTGYYKNLHAGLADNLFGETQTNDVFTFRPTAGIQDVASGDAPVGGGTIKKVEGNAVAWNQIVKNGDFADTSNWTVYDGTLSVNNNIATYTVTNPSNIYSLEQPFTRRVNHKYLLSASLKYNNTLPSSSPVWGIAANYNAYAEVTQLNTWYRLGGIVTDSGAGSSGFYLYLRTGNASVGDTVDIKDVMSIDLTLLGIDNLTTVEEVEQWLANNVGLKEYYPYNEGELIPVKDFKVKSVGFNAWDEEWELGYIYNGNNYSANDRIRSKNMIKCLPNTRYFYHYNENSAVINIFYYDADGNYISSAARSRDDEATTPENCHYIRFYMGAAYGNTYNHDICINLSYDGDRDGEYEEHWEREVGIDVTTLKGKLNGEGSSVVVFPDGMKSAGTVHDEIVKRGEQVVAIKRIGVVDLGTLNYKKMPYSSSGYAFVSEPGDGIDAKAYGTYLGCPCVCSKYYNGVQPTNDNNQADKTIGFHNWTSSMGSVNIKDSSYNNESAESIAALKTSLNGVMAYYELATPQEYILDEDILPVQYRVDNYGTEEVLLGNDEGLVSSSPKMTISYGINAADTIADLPHSYISATQEQDFTEAQKNKIALNIGTQRITLADKNNWNNKPNLWRGTLVLYDALVSNNQIDNNTIYVIIESLS